VQRDGVSVYLKHVADDVGPLPNPRVIHGRAGMRSYTPPIQIGCTTNSRRAAQRSSSRSRMAMTAYAALQLRIWTDT
jgi:hypothetical protein